MKRAVLDIGNTRIKAAIFNDDAEIELLQYFSQIEPAILWLKEQSVDKLMSASVAQAILPAIQGIDTYSLTYESKLPFDNQYSSKATMGVDRIAALAAAAIDFPGKPVLIFDIGTCMTIDFLYPDGTYKGGKYLTRHRHAFKSHASDDQATPFGQSRRRPAPYGRQHPLSHWIWRYEWHAVRDRRLYPTLCRAVS